MLELFRTHDTGLPVSGIRASRTSGKLAIVQSEHKRLALVDGGASITNNAGLTLPGTIGQQWSRKPYPIVELDGYVRTNGFDCSFAPDDRIVYVTTPDTGLLSVDVKANTILDELGRPGEFSTAHSVPGSSGLVVAASLACNAGALTPAHAILDVVSRRVLTRSRYLGPKCVYSPAIRSLIVAKDLQGATELYFVPISSPTSVYTTRLVLYTRPDCLAVSLNGGHVAVLEIDRQIELSVLDLACPSGVLVHRHTNPIDRPDQALNLDLLGFFQDHLVIPKGDGRVVVLALPSLEFITELQAHSAPVTGIGCDYSSNALVTSSLAGDISFWQSNLGPTRQSRPPSTFDISWLGDLVSHEPSPNFADRELAELNAG